MPIFMDRHYLPEAATAEIVAQLHQEDLKIQDQYGCRGLTYWFDGKRKTAFCLIEAPNKESLKQMHDHAHGEVPNMIIEVNADIVESFLGRIEDPAKSQNTELNIINDPAFRTIMVTGIRRASLKYTSSKKLSSWIQNLNHSIDEAIKKFNGRIVQQKSDYSLTSFASVTNAVSCAMELQKIFIKSSGESEDSEISLNIGLHAGIPVSRKEQIFEDTIKVAEYLCDLVQGKIVVSAEVKDLYESENLNIYLDKESLRSINSSDEKFLDVLMDYIEKEWNNADLTTEVLSKNIGYSKSQLYRKMISLTGNSPNSFIREYRLNKALSLINKRTDNISQIAFKTGFNSPAYFSKCFQESFGVLPSEHIKNLV